MDRYKEVISATEGRLLISANSKRTAEANSEAYFQGRPQATHSVSVRASNVAFPDALKLSKKDTARSSSNQYRPREQQSAATVRQQPLSSARNEAVAIRIELAQPNLYVEGYDLQHSVEHSSTVLRGFVQLQVYRPVALSSLLLEFNGTTETSWPESWRVRHLKKVYSEPSFSHKWSLLKQSCTSTDMDNSHHPHSVQTDALLPSYEPLLQWPGGRPHQDPEDGHEEAPSTFAAGTYSFNFELPLDSSIPETIGLPMGRSHYTLIATAGLSSRSWPSISCSSPVTIIRTPCACSLEWTEPLIVHGAQNGLQYKFVLHGQSFRIGSRAPLSMLVLPELDRNWHRIKVSLVEDVRYRTRDGLAQREQSQSKAVLMDRRAEEEEEDGLGLRRSISTVGESMAYSLAGNTNVEKSEPWQGAREPPSTSSGEFNESQILDDKVNLQLPPCSVIHADTAYSSLYVRHWLVVSRLIPLEFFPTQPDHEY